MAQNFDKQQLLERVVEAERIRRRERVKEVFKAGGVMTGDMLVDREDKRPAKEKIKYPSPNLRKVNWIKAPLNFTPEEIIETFDFSEIPQENREAILSYAVRAQRLDNVFSRMGTRGFCANSCPRMNKYLDWVQDYGCCEADGFPHWLPGELWPMMILQLREGKKNAWKGQRQRKNACQYHSEKGCKLSFFKAPVCISYICRGIRNHLDSVKGDKAAKDFLAAMDGMLETDPTRNPEEKVVERFSMDLLFGFMDTAIVFGERYIEAPELPPIPEEPLRREKIEELLDFL